MADQSLKITYKIYLEAEDASQSRIRSSASFVRNIMENCNNVYFHSAQVDDESDVEDYILRLYVEHEINEEVCSSEENAKTFLEDMAEVLDMIAQANSYIDMDGSFSLDYAGEKQTYSFKSESGQGLCEFTEVK